ncbi:major facilitator superfamily permease [Gluconobacter frateurii M-2]|nr:major facilitator superfamily permease [Gluconobacter frateurii M-2]
MRSAQRRLRLSYAMVCGGPMALQSFAALWLHQQGLAAGAIGAVIGWSLCGATFLGLLTGALTARYPNPRALILLLLLGAIIAASNLAFARTSHARIAGWCGLSLCAGLCVPLLDATAFLKMRSGVQFCATRSAASLSYLCGSLAVGFASSHSGVIWAFPVWGLASTGLALIVVALLFPRDKVDPQPLCADGETTSSDHRPAAEWMLPAVLVLCAAGLVEASHALNAIVMLEWRAKGYTPQLCAMLWQVGALSDIILLWVLSRVTVRSEHLLVIGGIAAEIRWFGMASGASLPMTIVLQMLHALSATGTYIATAQLIDRLMPARWRITGQTAVWGVLGDLAKGVAIISTGHLYETYGVHAFRLMAGLASVGTGVALCAVAALRRKKVRRASKKG